jgi:colanic acid/amylovoran biosynthesis glycosyltransferase
VRSLHLFNRYLADTQNWSFGTLIEIPDSDILVAANTFLKNNFYPNKFEYFEFPVREIDWPALPKWATGFNRLVRALRTRLYPRYIASAVKRVDLVHSHFGQIGWTYLGLARMLDAPHIVAFYGADYEKLPYEQPIWRDRYRELFQRADLFLCEGTHGAALLEKQGCTPSKIRVSRLGVRTSEIAPTRRVKRSGSLSLVQVATMTEKKGHLYALEAFLRALSDCPNMTLTFVGSDVSGAKVSIAAQLEDRVREADASHRVRFVPRIAFSRLHEYLADFHVFLHPSVYAANRDSEGGAPIVLLDAQATGMPAIATTHCDIPDEVVHGETGLLAPERDVEALAEHIRRFYAMDQDEYDGFAAAARKHVENHYDIRQNAAGLRRIYDEVLSSR